ncbi:hypothetical protein [Shimazuella kribbensis]|uniref:hypothetical protein n=1 Tax=Shimazuella kribbensis TaxID=139808 RepID=UPI000425045A|nr:hypothetical protein [Shimazuella kribbensis]
MVGTIVRTIEGYHVQHKKLLDKGVVEIRNLTVNGLESMERVLQQHSQKVVPSWVHGT